VPIALQYERPAIRMPHALGDPLWSVAGTAHKRNRRVSRLVKAEGVIAGGFRGRLPHSIAEAVPVPLLLFPSERGASSRDSGKELLLRQQGFLLCERDRLRPAHAPVIKAYRDLFRKTARRSRRRSSRHGPFVSPYAEDQTPNHGSRATAGVGRRTSRRTCGAPQHALQRPSTGDRAASPRDRQPPADTPGSGFPRTSGSEK
jgi:hypothetical protein